MMHDDEIQVSKGIAIVLIRRRFAQWSQQPIRRVQSRSGNV
jgi:hypothetical protein